MKRAHQIGCLGAARIAKMALCDPAKVTGGVKLRSVAARDEDRARRFAEMNGFELFFPQYADVIADECVTLVYNPLPINLHAEWTIRALQAGKHVLCEKPFAMNTSEAEAVINSARQSGRRVIEAFHYRYHPAFETMIGWIRNGEIGDLKTVEARFTVPVPEQQGTEIRHLRETGGGSFMDLGCYALHWARSVAGTEPESVESRAVLTPRGVDESMEAKLQFPTGVVASLYSSMAMSSQLDNRLLVEGTGGRILFENPLGPHRGAKLLLQTPKRELSAPISRVSTYVFQLAAVIEALETGAPLPTEGSDILAQQQAIDAVYSAAGLSELRQGKMDHSML